MSTSGLEVKRQALLERRENTDKEIAELDKQIEAEKKPKLRHGDYGVKVGQSWAHIHGQTFWTDERVTRPKDRVSDLTDEHFLRSKEILNFEDDLKALQEKVTEYSTGSGMQVYIDEDGWLRLSCRSVSEKNMDGFIMALRQMRAEQKRKNNE